MLTYLYLEIKHHIETYCRNNQSNPDLSKPKLAMGSERVDYVTGARNLRYSDDNLDSSVDVSLYAYEPLGVSYTVRGGNAISRTYTNFGAFEDDFRVYIAMHKPKWYLQSLADLCRSIPVPYFFRKISRIQWNVYINIATRARIAFHMLHRQIYRFMSSVSVNFMYFRTRQSADDHQQLYRITVRGIVQYTVYVERIDDSLVRAEFVKNGSRQSLNGYYDTICKFESSFNEFFGP